MFVFETIITEWVVFPFVTMLIAIFIAPLQDDTLATFLSVSLFTGFYFGRRHAMNSDLPDNFAARYWPLITPMVLILAGRIFSNIAGYDDPSFLNFLLIYKETSFHVDEAIIGLTLCFVPFILAFTAYVPLKSKLANTKWRWSTCVFVVTLFSLLVWQAQVDRNRYVIESFEGATVSDEDIIGWYWPWAETGRLAKLDTQASLLINENYPTVDGSTSFVPIYSAVANEIYQVDDKNELKNYITCSKSAGAYNRLISGDVDVIFALQPSDGHLEAAKNAGVELQLTPIAKEAFVFFVNNSNTVSDLSIEQIQDIYLNKITNWKQIGGENKKIMAFQRPLNSGSQTAMLKEVMKDKKLPPPLETLRSRSMGGIVRDVALFRDQEESIGYSFRFFAQVMVLYDDSSMIRVRVSEDVIFLIDNGSPLFYDWRGRPRPGSFIPAEEYYPDTKPVKLLSVNGIAPTPENIRNGSYPFTTDIFAVTAGASNPHVRSLIDWLLSPQGQELVEKTGYVGIISIPN